MSNNFTIHDVTPLHAGDVFTLNDVPSVSAPSRKGVLKGSAIRIAQYGSYLAENGNAISVPYSSDWPSLAGADLHLFIANQVAGVAVMPPLIDIAHGTINGIANLNFDLPSSATRLLTLFNERAYAYSAVAFLANGDQVQLTEWSDCTAIPGIEVTS